MSLILSTIFQLPRCLANAADLDWQSLRNVTSAQRFPDKSHAYCCACLRCSFPPLLVYKYVICGSLAVSPSEISKDLCTGERQDRISCDSNLGDSYAIDSNTHFVIPRNHKIMTIGIVCNLQTNQFCV